MREERAKAVEADRLLPIKETIASLADSNQPLLSSRLADLSDLNPEELGFLDDVWGRIEPKRRRQIMHRLAELAEDNVVLSFDSIFKHHLKDQEILKLPYLPYIYLHTYTYRHLFTGIKKADPILQRSASISL